MEVVLYLNLARVIIGCIKVIFKSDRVAVTMRRP